jgi:hypothetical protein
LRRSRDAPLDAQDALVADPDEAALGPVEIHDNEQHG